MRPATTASVTPEGTYTASLIDVTAFHAETGALSLRNYRINGVVTK